MVATISRAVTKLIVGMALVGCSSARTPPIAVVPPPIEVVSINQVEITSADPNLICVTAFTSDGKGENSSCTSPNATKPMIAISGSRGNSRSIIVLDPTKQAVAMRIQLGEEWITVPITQETEEAHLMAVWLVNSPDKIEVVDEEGQVLASVPPE